MTATVHGQAPERSLIQRLTALQNANHIRTRRAVLKRDIKAGRESARLILLAPPEFTRSMKVIDLLLAVPKVGRVRADRWLKLERVSHSKTVGGLSERQRLALAALLGGRS